MILFYKQTNQYKYIHTFYSALCPEGKQRHLRYFSEMPTFYQNDSLDKYCRRVR
jgi:hypothetical protein